MNEHRHVMVQHLTFSQIGFSPMCRCVHEAKASRFVKMLSGVASLLAGCVLPRVKPVRAIDRQESKMTAKT